MRAATIHARLDTCPRCGAAIIVALDHHTAALTVRADPLPLDAETELHARLSGRLTYNVLGRDDLQLHLRDTEHMASRGHPVVATHECPGPIPATAIPSAPVPAANPAEPDLFTHIDDDVPDGFPF
ncbi:hypothetical protein [Nocardiopsis salina]|uniref:hypothetical protein n=1 Tax=Nocardiopsis salina TaxID=245836 RepID=UPI00034C9E97|nr:hypothetical protein [Nocardiopsis salina]